MKKIIYLLLIIVFSSNSELKATHITGYDICMISTGVDSYKFRLVVYRDANTTSPLASTFDLKIYRNFDNLPAPIPTVTLNRVSITPLVEVNPCIPTNIEKQIFESSVLNLAAFNSSAGYYISRGYCCRPNGISNIINSGSVGLIFTMDFPPLNPASTTRNNSSPEFRNTPIVTMEINKTYNFDFNIVDPDGDSLVFYKTENLYPLGGPQSTVSDATKPFTKIDYAAGYSLNSNIADGAPDFLLNNQTGTLSYKPTKIGKYILSLKVEEWKRRSGNTLPYKIGEVRREIQVHCISISNTPPPVITDSKNRVNSLRDTINLNGTTIYSNQFNSQKISGKNVYIKLVAENGLNNNLFNSNLFDVIWGINGGVSYSGSAINGALLSSIDSVKTNFLWILDSTDLKKSPYKFKVISYDETCPLPLYDTLNVELFVQGQCYKSKNVTLRGCDSLIDLLGRKQYSSIITKDTVLSILGCDTILNQNIILLVGPKNNPINGDITAIPLSTHYYNTTVQPNVSYNWVVKNGVIISGQGTNEIGVIWNSSGYLTCTVEDSVTKCNVISTLSVDILTGINNIKNSNIKIYPNPTNNFINIEGLTKNENNTIQIFDVQGKLVITKNITEKGTIDLSELNKGVYVIKIGEVAQRIVKM
jgi:hypothetical protein